MPQFESTPHDDNRDRNGQDWSQFGHLVSQHGHFELFDPVGAGVKGLTDLQKVVQPVHTPSLQQAHQAQLPDFFLRQQAFPTGLLPGRLTKSAKISSDGATISGCCYRH